MTRRRAKITSVGWLDTMKLLPSTISPQVSTFPSITIKYIIRPSELLYLKNAPYTWSLTFLLQVLQIVGAVSVFHVRLRRSARATWRTVVHHPTAILTGSLKLSFAPSVLKSNWASEKYTNDIKIFCTQLEILICLIDSIKQSKRTISAVCILHHKKIRNYNIAKKTRLALYQNIRAGLSKYEKIWMTKQTFFVKTIGIMSNLIETKAHDWMNNLNEFSLVLKEFFASRVCSDVRNK